MAIYLGPKQVSQIKVIDTGKEVANDLSTLMDGGIYSVLTESLIDQIMTGAYTVE